MVSLIDGETLIPADHPVREIKRRCDEILTGMDRGFDEIHAEDDAPSVPPETLLKGEEGGGTMSNGRRQTGTENGGWR